MRTTEMMGCRAFTPMVMARNAALGALFVSSTTIESGKNEKQMPTKTDPSLAIQIYGQQSLR